MNYLNVVRPQIRKLRYQQGCSQSQLTVRIQLKGWNVSRESLAKIECQLHKVTDTELLYFADVLKSSCGGALSPRQWQWPFAGIP